MTRKQFAACAAHRIYILAESQNGECLVDTNYVPKVNKDLVICSHTVADLSETGADYLKYKLQTGFCLEKLSDLKPIALLPIGQSTNVEYVKKAFFPDSIEIRR